MKVKLDGPESREVAQESRGVFKGGTMGHFATEDQGNPGQVLERP